MKIPERCPTCHQYCHAYCADPDEYHLGKNEQDFEDYINFLEAENKKLKDFKMSQPRTCYDCIHNNICKYFKRWEDQFPDQVPYKSNSHIKDYIDGLSFVLSNVLSEACSFYEIKASNKPMQSTEKPTSN